MQDLHDPLSTTITLYSYCIITAKDFYFSNSTILLSNTHMKTDHTCIKRTIKSLENSWFSGM